GGYRPRTGPPGRRRRRKEEGHEPADPVHRPPSPDTEPAVPDDSPGAVLDGETDGQPALVREHTPARGESAAPARRDGPLSRDAPHFRDDVTDARPGPPCTGGP